MKGGVVGGGYRRVVVWEEGFLVCGSVSVLFKKGRRGLTVHPLILPATESPERAP